MLSFLICPAWLQDRLRTIGLRPINNVVDVTNFILHELGQPLHSFDANKIKGGKVIVNTCPEGTKFVTLDGVERTLTTRDLMICNTEEPMCIAGVFGGLDSGVTEATTDVFLESACFHPTWIRKTARRFGLNTDASFRFERGLDPNQTVYVLKRAALMIQELAGGQITGEIVDVYPKVMILSVPEGHDKPLKYPLMFQVCDAVLINKTDVLPYFDFDMDLVKTYIHQRNPQAEIFPVSAKTGEGITAWTDWLYNQVKIWKE